MAWGSGALDLNDQVLNLINEDPRLRRQAVRELTKKYAPGSKRRVILVKVMNAILGPDYHPGVADGHIEKVFNFNGRNIPDFNNECILSDGVIISSVKKIKFKKYRKLSVVDQKTVIRWVETRGEIGSLIRGSGD